MTEQSPNQPLVEMRNIGKAFSGVRVLDDVSFDLYPGEVHVLAGENGAGKSTLMKILSGVYTAYDGEISTGGKRLSFHSPHDAGARGIAMIHQEMSLIETMSVADNIFLGREQTRGGFWMRPGEQIRQAQAVLQAMDLALDVTEPVSSFPVSVRQVVEIAKALAAHARVLIMDEPTSALNEPEVERLVAMIAALKAQGCGIIFITHRMDEIYRIGDRITVLRDGRRVATSRLADVQPPQLIRWLVGRDMSSQFPPRTAQRGPVRLAVRDFSVPDPAGARRRRVERASFTVQAGEIVGIAGLQDSGNSILLKSLFGAYGPITEGRVELDGQPFTPRSPRHAIAHGLALVTNDRQGEGLVLPMSVAANLTLASMSLHSPGGWVRRTSELAAGARERDALRIQLAALRQSVATLSGGNQQKTVLGKWLETKPRLLLLDEPTRGVDVGAKYDMYELMNRWTREGIAILLITSEMPELLAMSDRIMVMHRGAMCAVFERAEATQEKIMRAAMGVAA